MHYIYFFKFQKTLPLPNVIFNYQDQWYNASIKNWIMGFWDFFFQRRFWKLRLISKDKLLAISNTLRIIQLACNYYDSIFIIAIVRENSFVQNRICTVTVVLFDMQDNDIMNHFTVFVARDVIIRHFKLYYHTIKCVLLNEFVNAKTAKEKLSCHLV